MSFSERERQIYKCPHTNRELDPLAVRRALTVESRGKFGAFCQDARDKDPLKAAVAQGALIGFARKAMGLDASVLDAVAWDALCAFTRWLSGKGPRVQSTPGSVPSTASLPGASTTTTTCG